MYYCARDTVMTQSWDFILSPDTNFPAGVIRPSTEHSGHIRAGAVGFMNFSL
jgi:hypothetical protein